MSRDRLVEFQSSQSNIEMQPLSGLDVAKDCDARLAKVYRNLEYLRKMYEQSLAYAHHDAKAAQLMQKIEECSADTKLKVSKLQRIVKGMKPRNEAELNQRKRLARKLKDSIEEFQKIQSYYKDKYEKRLIDQYRIVQPNASEDEIRKAIDSNDGRRVFAQELLSTTLRGEAKMALNDAQDQFNDLQQLEKSIVELHRMFEEVAMLVEAQNDVIEAIGSHVEQTRMNVEKSVVELESGVQLAKSSRKKRYVLCICCLLVLVAAGLALYFGVIKGLIEKK